MPNTAIQLCDFDGVTPVTECPTCMKRMANHTVAITLHGVELEIDYNVINGTDAEFNSIRATGDIFNLLSSTTLEEIEEEIKRGRGEDQ